jgi:hypothetical protein
VDYGLRAVPLTAGEHLVALSYRPLSVYVGAAVSVLMLAGAAAWMIVPERRRKQ